MYLYENLFFMEGTTTLKKQGGKRKKSGRKRILDKKVTVPIYPRLSRVILLGMDDIKELSHTAIEKEYLKRQKII